MIFFQDGDNKQVSPMECNNGDKPTSSLDVSDSDPQLIPQPTSQATSPKPASDISQNTDSSQPQSTTQSDTGSLGNKPLSVHVSPVDFMLGLADLTGELMRMAIHNAGTGNPDKPFDHCNFIRTMHNAFVSYGNATRELPRKLYTLKQSLQKVEAACYTLQVRGSEIPKHMLAEVLSSVDRGYNVDEDLHTPHDE